MILGTIQYSTVQYNTVQYNTVQYNTVQYSTVQCSWNCFMGLIECDLHKGIYQGFSECAKKSQIDKLIVININSIIVIVINL